MIGTFNDGWTDPIPVKKEDKVYGTRLMKRNYADCQRCYKCDVHGFLEFHGGRVHIEVVAKPGDITLEQAREMKRNCPNGAIMLEVVG